MRKEIKEKIIWKHESVRDILRDIIACVIIAYVATLSFLLVDSKIKYTNTMTDYVSSEIHQIHTAAPMVLD